MASWATYTGEFAGAWCNGSTADFGSVYPGSNPGAPAYQVLWIVPAVLDEEPDLDVFLGYVALLASDVRFNQVHCARLYIF
jgi:hypothetical protein